MILNRQLTRPIQMVLIALLIYVVGMQCCQNALAFSLQSASPLDCHQSQQSLTDTASVEANQSPPSTHDCHCEYNPTQVSWDYFDQVKHPQPTLAPYILSSVEPVNSIRFQDTIQTWQARPPPVSIAQFISSTILLI